MKTIARARVLGRDWVFWCLIAVCAGLVLGAAIGEAQVFNDATDHKPMNLLGENTAGSCSTGGGTHTTQAACVGASGTWTAAGTSGVYEVTPLVTRVIQMLGGLALLWMGWLVVRGLIRRFRGGGA